MNSEPLKTSEGIDKNDDIDRLLNISRLMLCHLENAVSSGEQNEKTSFYDKMFGTKPTYVDTLVAVAGLMLKLTQHKKTVVYPEEENAPQLMLDADDRVIIKDFISRRKMVSDAS